MKRVQKRIQATPHTIFDLLQFGILSLEILSVLATQVLHLQVVHADDLLVLLTLGVEHLVDVAAKVLFQCSQPLAQALLAVSARSLISSVSEVAKLEGIHYFEVMVIAISVGESWEVV